MFFRSEGKTLKKIILLIVGLIFIYLIIRPFQFPRTEESITYFPIDITSPFKAVNTSLSLLDKKNINQYSVQWRISSNLSKNAYLRQDVGLLFANGRLKGKMGNWEQNKNQLVQENILNAKESLYLDAITFHFAEIHQQNESIMSSQDMSKDELYVIDSSYSPLRSFRIPSTKEERDWKKVLDQATAQQLKNSWERAMTHFHIDGNNYKHIPLTQLGRYLHEPFTGFSQLKTNEIIGKLWEGIYKNYFLTIKKADGTGIDPINSTVPLILLSNDRTHLLVLFETSTGEPILLRQKIS